MNLRYVDLRYVDLRYVDLRYNDTKIWLLWCQVKICKYRDVVDKVYKPGREHGDVVDKVYKPEYKGEVRRKNRYGMHRWSKEKSDKQQG